MPSAPQPQDTTQVLALTDLAWEYLDRSLDSSLYFCQQAYALGQQLDYPYGMGLAKETEGILLHNMLRLEAATASFLEAAEHYEKAGARTAFAGLYNNLGILLLDTKDTLRALDYLERGLEYELAAGDTSDMLISQINIFVLYSASGELDKAEEGFREILPLAQRIGDDHLESVIRGNQAVIEQRRGNYHNALQQLEAVLLPGYDSLQHGQFYISATVSMAEILLHLDRPAAASDYLARARCVMDRTGDQRYLLAILALDVKLAEAKGDLAQQVGLLQRYHAAKDSLAEAENLQQIATLNANYEYLEQREQIARLQLENTLETQRAERQQILFAGVILLVALLAWMAFQFYRRRLRKEKAARARQEQLLAWKSQQLHDFTHHLAERNLRIQELEDSFSEWEGSRNAITATLSSQAILTAADWCKFQKLFHEVHPGFLPRMRRDTIDYTEGELRLAALLSLGLDRKTIADILGISPESVRKNVYRLERKVDLGREESLVRYLQKYRVPGSSERI